MIFLKNKFDNNLKKEPQKDDKILFYSALTRFTKMSFKVTNVCVILLITKLITKKSQISRTKQNK